MTAPDRLRAALGRLHWSGRSLAAILSQDERTVRRWAAGAYEPPEDVLAWLETLAAFHAETPPPIGPAGAAAVRGIVAKRDRVPDPALRFEPAGE